MLTLGQAAKETGLSKTAISRAIKNGKLSAARGENGEYQIDPAELFRVYPVTGSGNSQAERQATPQGNSGLQGQVDVLRELVEQVREERDDLRRRLDNAEEARQRAEQAQEKAFGELSRLTLLLTHQPAPAPEPEAQPTANQNDRPVIVRPWLLVALAFAALLAAAAALYFRQQ